MNRQWPDLRWRRITLVDEGIETMSGKTRMTPEERFERLVDEMSTEADVSPPTGGRGFGGSALTCRGKIFAMLVRGQLVVKLPRARVDALIAEGTGTPFDANKGRPMKEWVGLAPTSGLDWSAVATEALAFVRK